jgi:outer membrane protein assembly factor BamB
MRARKAFIFTADAVLAFYLITIILSILMLLSYSPRLYTEQSEAIVKDTMVALSSIKLRDVAGNPQYAYTNRLLNAKSNSLSLWPMFERTIDHNISLASVYPASNSTWMKYQVGPAGAITGMHTTPIVYYGKIIIASENGTYAYDENTGLPLWPTLPIQADSTPTTYSGRIIIGSLNGTLYALDERGQIIWNSTFSSPIVSSPLVHNGKVFVCFTNGSVMSFDVESGTPMNFSFTAPSSNVPISNITSSPAVYNKEIFIYSTNYTNDKAYITSIDEDSGAVLWNYSYYLGLVNKDLFVDPSPTVSNGMLYFSDEYEVIAMNATTGFTLWTYQSLGLKFTSSPAIDGTSLIIGCAMSTGLQGICIIDTATQSFNAINVGALVYSTPVVVNDSVIIASITPITNIGTVMVVNKQDLVVFSFLQPLWSYQIGQPIYSSPAVVNGRIYIGADDGNVTSFGNCSLWDDNMSVIDSIVAFWSINRTDCSRAIAKEFLDSALPQNYGFELVIKPATGSGLVCNRFGAAWCYYCNATQSTEWDSIYTNDCNQTKYQRFLIRDSRYISGVSEKGSTIYYAQNPIEIELRIWN